MAESKDWIEQDEFDRRKALFESKFVAKTSKACNSGTAANPVPEVEVVAVTVRGVNGDALWGPSKLGIVEPISVVMQTLASALEAKPGTFQLLSNSRVLRPSEKIGACEAINGAVELTYVRREHLPEDAVVVGDLAVWEVHRSANVVPQRGRDQEQQVVGMSLETGETFSCRSRLGRCNTIWVRFGKEGLYYNSSSHGTATFLLQTFDDEMRVRKADGEELGDDDNSDDDSDDPVDTLCVIEGHHTRLSKVAGSMAKVQEFCTRLASAAGQEPPNPGDGRAWYDILDQLQVDRNTASILTVCMLPWLDEITSMNESLIWEWSQAGFPGDEAKLSGHGQSMLTTARTQD